MSIAIIDSMDEIIKELAVDYPKISNFERASLAIQIQRNQILEAAFATNRKDEIPPALEAIAIALGY